MIFTAILSILDKQPTAIPVLSHCRIILNRKPDTFASLSLPLSRAWIKASGHHAHLSLSAAADDWVYQVVLGSCEVKSVLIFHEPAPDS